MLEWVSGFGSGFLGYAIPFLFVLTVVVFFHELGHFLVARWCGVKVDVFSIGFGPELVGRNDRHGTRWRLAAIPLGGYVKFAGDDNAASVPDRGKLAAMTEDERRGSFAAKPVSARAAVVAAGPIANFLLTIVIFAVLFATFGRPITEARVDSMEPGSVAEAAGFQVGDVILSIDGEPIGSFSDVQRIVSVHADEPLLVTVDRGGVEADITVTPKLTEVTDRFGNVHRVGVLGIRRDTTGEAMRTESFSPPAAVIEGVKETWYVVARTVDYLADVVTGRESADQLGGPIRVAQISGQVATLGFVALLNLTAVLSVSIGLLNLMPIPMLDGGHLVYYAIEAARGRPLSERAQDVGFRIGLTLVLLLMIFATWNDILHVWPA
jgi:regulator of sigma E protease